MNNKNLEIIPCPYCNGEPKPIRCGDQKEYYAYICKNCYKTPVPYEKATPNLLTAGKRWNHYAVKAKNKEK